MFRVGCGRALLDGWRLLLINNVHDALCYLTHKLRPTWNSGEIEGECALARWSSYVTPRTSSGRSGRPSCSGNSFSQQ